MYLLYVLSRKSKLTCNMIGVMKNMVVIAMGGFSVDRFFGLCMDGYGFDNLRGARDLTI